MTQRYDGSAAFMDESNAAFELPLFLLHAVLFPQSSLQLRVFEARYKRLVDFCRQKDHTFGVLLIKSGKEVGGPSEPYLIGTTARIEKLGHQEDSTLVVSAVGVRKFQLHSMMGWDPFPMGLVSYLDDDTATPDIQLAERLRANSVRCVQLLLGLNGEWARDWNLPRDPSDLSFLLASRMPITLHTKQELLETTSTAQRLKLEEPLLEDQQRQLHEQLLTSMWMQSARLN